MGCVRSCFSEDLAVNYELLCLHILFLSIISPIIYITNSVINEGDASLCTKKQLLKAR